MACSAYYLELLLACWVLLVATNGEETARVGQVSAAYDELYADGMEAYYKDDWPTTVVKIEEAIADWRRERQSTFACRRECQEEFDASKDRRIGSFAMDYLHYMNHMRNCSQACLTKNMGLRFQISKNTRSLFENRVPYSFLQYAYHKSGNNRMAVKAAVTFLRFNPKDATVNDNMKYYQELPELRDLDFDTVESLEPVQHHELYEKGRKAYLAERWQETVDYYEEALKEYRKAYTECQMICDIEMEKTQQYIAGGVYAYHMQLLLCRLDCPRQLSKLLNYPQPGYFSQHYDFLQYSYSRLNRLDEATKCAVTYLLLNPDSEHMKNNINYYEKKGFSVSDFEPREEGRYLYEDIRKQMEILRDVKSYLVNLDEEYKGHEDLEDTTYKTYLAHGLYPDEAMPEEKKEEPKETIEKPEVEEEKSKTKEDMEDEPYKRFPLPTKEHIENVLKTTKDFEGASLVMMEQQLNGSYRVVIDGIATEEQCKKLMNLGLFMGHAGDGYGDKPSPHTVKEQFLGVNVNNATWAAAKGEIDLEDAELYVNLSEKVRQVTEAYFRLTTPLYFTYTHLVCRKAISDANEKGMHISHPVHSDNCVLQDGEVLTCAKEHPAYTWRDYSAILYFNDDFTGGQFIFAAPNQTVEAIVKPKCGRMVAFSAGFENLHGVLGIKQGTRCALPVWFTLDKKHDEQQRYDAKEILSSLRNKRDSESKSTNGDHKEL